MLNWGMLNRPIIFQAFGLAFFVLLVDQLTKMLVLNSTRLTMGEIIEALPFLHITLVWNKGISLGMLQSSSDYQRWLLMLFTSLVSAMIVYWIITSRSIGQARSLGLVLGGAIGNIIDRARFGAVVDFIDVRGIPYWSYVFNVADAAICIGVAFYLYSSFVGQDGEEVRP